MILRSARGDGYARLTTSGTDVLLVPDESGLLFVDMAFGAEAWDLVSGALRSLPPSLLGESSRVVFRSPVVRWASDIAGVDQDDPRRLVVGAGPGWPDGAAALAEQLERVFVEHHLPRRPIGVVELPIGGDPVSPGVDDPADLALCRSVELEAFLERNGAIWKPSAYHYQLPSGHHSGTFVRVADALNDPRAPAALATWLHADLSEGTAVVVDSGTLMPLVQQLDLLIRRASVVLPISYGGLLLVEALDRYPLSRFEFLRRFKPMHATDVLALLSVSSTGRTYRLLRQSLQETVEGTWRAECLVARHSLPAQGISSPTIPDAREPWLTIDRLLPPSKPGAECRLCRSAERPLVIHIDPTTFAAMALPAPSLLMPDTASARRNSSLFEGYQALPTSEISVQLSGTERSRLRTEPYHRPDEPRRVRFEPTAHLLVGDDLTERLKSRIKEIKGLRQTDPDRKSINRALDKLRTGRPTVAVCDCEELEILAKAIAADAKANGKEGDFDTTSRSLKDATHEAARDRFLVAAQAVCPSVKVLITDEPTELAKGLKGHRKILLIAAGLQTGVTLTHLVVSVQDLFRERDEDPVLHGLVLHAHPYDGDAWASVRNSFGGRQNPSLLALWLTYLPVQSPFADEHDLFQVVQDEWFKGARPGAERLWKSRSKWVRLDRPATADPEPSPPSPLWSPRPVALRRTSIYGRLDDRHTLAAVGAALYEALDRHVSKGAPEWVRIDLPNAFRSYFDGLIHACVLRWVTPQRAWWGDGNECRSLLGEMKGRLDDSDWQLLLPELLLAAAMGKVPDEGVELLLAEADNTFEDHTATRWPDDVLDFVDLGRVLVEHFWKVPLPVKEQ